MILTGDVKEVLDGTYPDPGVFQSCITSPPYWRLRRYLPEESPLRRFEIGSETSLEEHIERLVTVFRSVRRVLRDDGTLWVNYGDMYNSDGGSGSGGNVSRPGRRRPQRNEAVGLVHGYKAKDLILAASMLALALQRDGWYLRSEVIWHKPSAMPESAPDRPGRDHEKIYLFSKSRRYLYRREAIVEPFRSPEHKRGVTKHAGGWAKGAGDHDTISHNTARRSGHCTLSPTQQEGRFLRTVWTINPQPFRGAHFATYPVSLAERCIRLTTREGDLVLDPFLGSGSTAVAAIASGRKWVGIELNPEYADLARSRVQNIRGLPA